MELEKTAFFEYNIKKKRIEGGIKLLLIGLFILVILTHFFNFFPNSIINIIFDFLKQQFSGKSLLSPFFIGLIGGLFFISVPIEVLFISLIYSLDLNPWVIAAFLFIGLSISYPIDYFIGKLFSKYATKLVSPKQFYKIKAKLNRYGKGVIFLFNVLPLPSQILTFICGVFKYNKIRYFTIWLIAWTIKLSIIVLFNKYIMWTIDFVIGLT